MTEFNYLVHGSAIFAGGLLIGLIGALISTHGTRRELKRLRQQVSELENARPVSTANEAPAPRAAATPVKAAATAVASTAAVATPAMANDREDLSENIQRPDVHDDTFDHTRVKTATPDPAANTATFPDKNFDPRKEASNDGAPIKVPEPRPAAHSANPNDVPKISLGTPERHQDDKPADEFSVPRLTPSTATAGMAATAAAGAAAAGVPDLNLRVDRDDDIHGRIEPSLGVRDSHIPDADARDATPEPESVEPDSVDTPGDTIWDNHDEVAAEEQPSGHGADSNFSAGRADDLPPINDDGTVGFQDNAAIADQDGDVEIDEDTRKRNLRKALLTGGTLLGVDND